MPDRWKPSGNAVLSEESGGASLLRLNRPEVLNALTIEMLIDLAAGIRWFGTGGRARGVILTGAGRAFSSGDDLKVTEDLERRTFEELIDAFQDVTRAIYETDVPTIAALNGIAVGGAAEIACACDLRIGCRSSEFLFPENALGLTISNGSTVILPALVGRKALGLVLLGERIDAARAQALGLLDVIVDDSSEVESQARRLAEALGEVGRATPLHIALLRLPAEDVEAALRREREAAMAAWDRGWPQRGIRGFTQRRAVRDQDPT